MPGEATFDCQCSVEKPYDYHRHGKNRGPDPECSRIKGFRKKLRSMRINPLSHISLAKKSHMDTERGVTQGNTMDHAARSNFAFPRLLNKHAWAMLMMVYAHQNVACPQKRRPVNMLA